MHFISFSLTMQSFSSKEWRIKVDAARVQILLCIPSHMELYQRSPVPFLLWTVQLIKWVSLALNCPPIVWCVVLEQGLCKLHSAGYSILSFSNTQGSGHHRLHAGISWVPVCLLPLECRLRKPGGFHSSSSSKGWNWILLVAFLTCPTASVQ